MEAYLQEDRGLREARRDDDDGFRESCSSSSTDALLSSVPPAGTSATLPNLTEFRTTVDLRSETDSDHEDIDDGSGSSWSCDSVSGVVPGRHVRASRAPLHRPVMPHWSPPSLPAGARPTPAASACSDSTDSAGPTSQSPIRRKRQSSGRRSRPREVSASLHEVSPARAADQASVELFPRCLEFGNVVQWCRQTCTVSVHNPSRFTAQLHGGIISGDTKGPNPYALQLDDSCWPALPPMSTVTLQVRSSVSVATRSVVSAIVLKPVMQLPFFTSVCGVAGADGAFDCRALCSDAGCARHH